MKHHILAAALFFLSAFPVVAQAQSVSPGETGEPAEEIVELSPFVVSGASDHGYQATNTEAGSRLNTRLMDTSAPITIMTMDFLEDIGALSIDEALDYGLNSGYNNEDNDEGYRIRGMRANKYGRNNFMRGVGSTDNYNTTRATVSRGPNSILFGNADPSGIVNITTKMANISRNRYEVGTRFTDDDAWRVTGGLNHVIVPKRVAIRADFLNQDLKGYRKPAIDKWKAFYVAGTVVLVDTKNYNLTVRFDYEQLQRERNRARVDVVWDMVSHWRDNGSITSPYGNGVTSSSLTPAGATRAFTSNALVSVDQSLAPVPVLNWINTGRGGQPTGGANRATEDIWPLYVNAMGVGGPLDEEHDRYRTLYIEQRIGKNLYVQLGYMDYSWDRWRGWSGSGYEHLYVDINEQLPSRSGIRDVNAAPNPNVGQYYFEKHLAPQQYISEESTLRAAVTYELDLRPLNQWLGKHRLIASFDRMKDYSSTQDYHEVNLTPLGGYTADLSHATNRIYRRHYVYRDLGILTAGSSMELISEGKGGVNSGYARVGGNPRVDNMEADSYFGAIQSFWLKGRLVTIAGYRHDKVTYYNFDLAHTADPVTGVWEVATRDMLDSTPANEVSVNTSSYGGVFHVTKGLSVFYNQSSNFKPDTASKRNILGEMIPSSVGKGQDAGVKFQLFNGKLSGSLSVYKSTKERDTSTSGIQGLGDITGAINDIWDILGESQTSLRRPGAGYSVTNTRGYDARGVELELTYNPTRNWRISLTAARNKTEYSNISRDNYTYVERHMSEWREKGDWVLTGETVNQLIDNTLNPALQEVRAQEGDSALYVRPWSATLVTRYRFSQPAWLKGFAVGGSVRFRDRSIIGFGENADGTINRAVKYMGDYLWQTDAFISYERTFFKKRIRWKSQLAVKNLLDYTEPLRMHALPDGRIDKLQLVRPRTFTWTNTFSF